MDDVINGYLLFYFILIAKVSFLNELSLHSRLKSESIPLCYCKTALSLKSHVT